MGKWILNKINDFTIKYNTYVIRKIIILMFDLIILILAYLISMYFTETKYYMNFQEHILFFTETIIIISLLFYYGCYSNLWSSKIEKEIICIVIAVITSFIVQIIINTFIVYKVITSFYIMNMSLTILGISIIRILYRAMRKTLLVIRANNNISISKKVLIIGAGSAGQMIIKELYENPTLRKYPVGIIDDDNNKLGKLYNNVQVVGNVDYIKEAVRILEVDEIIFSISKIDEVRKRYIIKKCHETKCKVKTIPGISQLIDGKVSIKEIEDVKIEDLLERKVQKLEDIKVKKSINNKRILITGAGGSIGSELCRQIASLNPSQIMLVDIYENNVYEIQQELIRKYKSKLNITVFIASVRDYKRIDKIFNKYKPEIVFHAAAHKHVPLMEDSPCEAIKNNIFGTLNIAKSSIKYQVDKFVLISTDKAVNPTNIMGASKRCCEMIVQTMNQESNTDFVSVRFGNVLGSNGSVVPLFKRQIEEGGPVLVTHPEITRFFMTISEAVSLVMEACAMAKGGEIFVLNMGEPVKILDLAKNLITLSGFKPDVDIKIEFTGLRPGEKLYEEVLMKEEGLKSTENNKIFIGSPISIKKEFLEDNIIKLKDAVSREDKESVRFIMKNLVDTYVIREMENMDTIAITNE